LKWYGASHDTDGERHEPLGETAMTRTTKARFSKGVFEPLEPVVTELVKEGEEVTITIETASTTSSGDPLRETAGGWRDLIEAEALKEAIYRDRLVVPRRATVTA
jgi:predicted DNA-binding antitoxin AbrB/MazE fold protein